MNNLLKIRALYQRLPNAIKNFIVYLVRLYNNIFRRKKIVSRVYDKNLLSEYNNQRPFGTSSVICHAPFTSMFFSIFGKASPCYATYYKFKNTYPALTIKQIWEGEDFENIRKKMKEGDLREICTFCHVPLINKNFGSMLARKYDHYQFYGSKYPSIIEFELSNKCNLECVMCNGFLSSSIRRNREKLEPLPIVYDKKFVQELEEFIPYLKVAEFTGGDPFLIDIYYDIWEAIIKINPDCNILITTNGNTMNSKVHHLLERHKKISFNISIDSLQKETYEAIRVNSKLENVLKNIDTFNEYCKKNNTQLNLMVCPLRNNWKEFPDFVNFCNQKDIGLFFHTVMKPYHLALWSLPSKELLTVYNYLSAFDFPAKSENQKINKQNFGFLKEQINTWYKQSLERETKGYALNVSISEQLNPDEKLFIESVVYYYSENYASESNDAYLECSEICAKIEVIFSKLPVSIDRKVFLSLPLDRTIFEIFRRYSVDDLLKILTDWVNNKPVEIKLD